MENSLPPCHSRRDFDEARGLFFCGHPKVHTKKNIVTMAVCQSCSYWQGAAPKQMRPFPTITGGSRDGPCMFLGDLRRTELCKSCRGEVKLKVFSCGHPSHEETTFRDCTTCFDYEQKLEKGTVSDWAVGVTTAPRTKPTIDRCLASLVQAGWSDFRLFADAGAEIPTAFANHPITRRDVKLGAWPNWYLGLGELFMRFPHADAFMIVQDDTVLCRNVRPLLERILWPSSKVGVVSVYSPSTYTGGPAGLNVVDGRLGLFGANTFIFPNAAVRSLLSHGRIVNHRLSGPSAGLRLIDDVVGFWSHDRDMPAYYHTPSLGQHIGESSTIWNIDQLSGKRISSDFVGQEFDALCLEC